MTLTVERFIVKCECGEQFDTRTPSAPLRDHLQIDHNLPPEKARSALQACLQVATFKQIVL